MTKTRHGFRCPRCRRGHSKRLRPNTCSRTDGRFYSKAVLYRHLEHEHNCGPDNRPLEGRYDR